MQEQYRDGSVGPVKPFDLDEMRKALNDPEVDSVKVISKKDQIDKARLKYNEQSRNRKRNIRKRLKKRSTR